MSIEIKGSEDLENQASLEENSNQPEILLPAVEKEQIVVHISGGEIGGIGKSTVGKAIVYYYQKKGKQVIVVDCDRTNPDVWNMYQKNEVEAAHRLELSDNTDREDAADEILNWAAAKKLPVLVNLPAQADTNIRAWLDRTVLPLIQLPAEEKDVEIQINYWFVTNGFKESIDLFLNSLWHYGGHIQHILVRNNGIASNWDNIDNDQNLKHLTQKIIRLPKATKNQAIIEKPEIAKKDKNIKDVDETGHKILPIIQIEFPRLAKRERDKLNAEGISFREALSASTNGNGRKIWPVWERSRLYNFITDAVTVFAETGVLP
ncbi:hypothetical protein H6S82_00020 [Planktothrix sp. FACHB-1355]|uniref:CobQ/CobB/MinD/ParA nucleotide binding domain-containing protein n=1 Tax=Aerosakkonema funiforme FACHB-1375 TaxID=2949571 RepID=A0A926ZG57_9CYAN|nr:MULTISPECIES: hypothetical protein [Oscillatoriales]MBD2181838.1 hypothetical protein [Aerosakkonema funiforme FACHB-1375]MBD3557258.1 hypothetical protein [Planktothrix sp. FACHB-1355]